MWRFSSVLSAFAASFLLIYGAAPVFAGSSVNVPVGSSVYRDIERLEVKGLLKGSLLTTRPISRLEAARLIAEAEDAFGGLDA